MGKLNKNIFQREAYIGLDNLPCLVLLNIKYLKSTKDYPSQYMPLAGKPGISTNIDMYI
jgi:hypothetical protein